MGVKPLFAWLKKVCPHAFRRVHISMFAQTRIAIDATLLCHSLLSSSYSLMMDHIPIQDLLLDNPRIFTEQRCLEARETSILRIRLSLLRFLQNNITPILVFDGLSAPEKICARKKRAAQRDLKASKIEELKKEIFDIVGIQDSSDHDGIPLCGTPSQRDVIDPFLTAVGSIQAKDSLEKLRAMYKNANMFEPKSEIDAMRKYCEEVLGIACVTAPDEAEKYCAYLASTGFTSASYTRDGDSLAFGAPILLTELEWDNHFKCVMTPIVLDHLKISKSQFVDLCILFGCDFNETIPKLGPISSWKIVSHALKKFSNFERIIEHALAVAHEVLRPHEIVGISAETIAGLNAERCRQIFLDTSEMANMFPKFSPIRTEFKKMDVKELMGLMSGSTSISKANSKTTKESKLFSQIGEDFEFMKAVNDCKMPHSIQFHTLSQMQKHNL